jgi:hypothetical protein
LHELDTITEMHRARLAAAAGLVPGVLWPVLFGGASVTIAYTFFFGSENVREVNPDVLSEVVRDFGSPASGGH